MNNRHKKMALILSAVVSVSSTFAIGLDVGVSGCAGASFGVGGKQVETNAFPWESIDTFFNSFSGGADIGVDCLLTPNWIVQGGLGVMSFGRVYTTSGGNSYGNGSVSLRYNRLSIPLGVQYRYILSKTTKDIRSLYVSAGIVCSLLIGTQIYKDAFTTASLHFLQPLYSFAGYVSAAYVKNLGVGNLSLGVRCMIDIVPSKYTMEGLSADVGHALTVVPVIGFSLPIIKHQAVEKEQAKRKRVDVIWK